MPFSSQDLIRAVERQGYAMKGGKGRTGTHRVWARSGASGDLHQTVVIPLDKREIPRGTLGSILRQLGIDEATLREWMK